MMLHTFITTLFALVVWHALADYPLQGDFLSKAKNRHNPIEGIDWRVALFMHSLIHGGGVWMITGSAWLGALEIIAHFIIDDAKNDRRINFKEDQFLHLILKALYAVIVAELPTCYYGIVRHVC